MNDAIQIKKFLSARNPHVESHKDDLIGNYLNLSASSMFAEDLKAAEIANSQAIALINRRLADSSNDGKYRTWLSMALERSALIEAERGDFQAQAGALLETLEIIDGLRQDDPQKYTYRHRTAQLRLALAEAYEQLGDDEEALKQCQDAVRFLHSIPRRQWSPSFHAFNAQAQFGLKGWKEMLDSIEAYLSWYANGGGSDEPDAKHGVIWWYKAAALHHTGHPEEARKLFDRLCEQLSQVETPESEWLSNQKRAAESLGLTERQSFRQPREQSGATQRGISTEDNRLNKSSRLQERAVESKEAHRRTTTVDLASLMQGEGTTIYGADAGDYASVVKNAGDINNDGFDDFMIGSGTSDGPDNSRPNAGGFHVIFGSPSLSTTIDLADLGSAGVTIYGATEGDNLYQGASAGDVNGDGIDDLIFGSGPASPGVGANTYVIFGKEDWNATPTIDLATGAADVTIQRADETDQLFAVSGAGDVNKDGFDDLIVGARNAGAANNLKQGAGESYVIFGGDLLPATIDLSLLGTAGGTAGLTLYGANRGDWAGYRVSEAGDVNGDEIDDFMISAQYANEVYLIYGDSALHQLGTIDLGQLGSAGVTIPGSDSSSNFGRGIDAAGDINGDGYDDLILTSQTESDTYAIYGGPNLPATIDVDNLGMGGVKFTGVYTNWAVAGAGDANGDGYDDLIIDDRNYPEAAQTYLVFGGPLLDSTIDLTNLGTGGLAFRDIESGDNPSRVSRAGDVNGDGFADFLIGAAGGDGPSNSREDAGESYLIYGGVLFESFAAAPGGSGESP